MTEPFEIRVPEAVLEDLHERLARARVPDSLPGYGWEQGTEAGYLREVLDYWRQGYDWRKHEQVLNRMAHFRAGPAGGRIHFIHQRAADPGAKPLLLIHGWPGSVFEFYKLIPRLTHPERHGGRAEDGLHVVAPSLPGYGFSDAPREPGFTPRRVGRVLHQLMHDTLGYRDYVVQGGDWGAVIGSWIAHDFGPACAGLHLNMVGL
ncbi:MAG: epoxide hydrolase, partial [bacterium]